MRVLSRGRAWPDKFLSGQNNPDNYNLDSNNPDHSGCYMDNGLWEGVKEMSYELYG